jgi:hypothetical protein
VAIIVTAGLPPVPRAPVPAEALGTTPVPPVAIGLKPVPELPVMGNILVLVPAEEQPNTTTDA